MFDATRPLNRSRHTHLPFAWAWSGDEPRPGVMSVDGDLDGRDLIVLDLTDLTFMDVLGLHAIIDATARAQRLGRRLVLLCGSPAVQRVFALTGTAGSVEFHTCPAPPAA